MFHHPVPPILYKYTSSKTALEILKNGKLRWSDPRIFNDIAECQRMPQFHPTLDEALQMLPARILSAANGTDPLDEDLLAPGISFILRATRLLLERGCQEKEILKMLRSKTPNADRYYEDTIRHEVERLFLKNPRTLCLTENPENQFMWGTYAESHKGIVLGFKHISEESTPLQLARKVAYTDNPVISSGLDMLLYSKNEELGEKATDIIFYSKATVWQSEEEWRVMTTRPLETGSFGDYPFLPEELDVVIIGARAEAETTKQAQDIVREKYPHAKIFSIKTHHGKIHQVPIA